MLRDVDLVARPGETTAVIGSTGSGKTTLLNLVPRLFDATGGAVLVDGVDVRELDPALLARTVGAGARRSRTCSPAPSPPTCATATRTPPTRSCGGRWRSRRRATSSSACRRAWTPRSPRAAPMSPAASASAWPSPGRWCAGRRSTSSTTRSPPWTTPPTRALRAALRPGDRRRDRRHRRPAGQHHPRRRPHRRAGRGPGRRYAAPTSELMDEQRDLPRDRALPAHRAGGAA